MKISLKSFVIAAFLFAASHGTAHADPLQVVILNNSSLTATYANVWGYNVDYSSGTEIAFIPNVPPRQLMTRNVDVPSTFVRYWGSFYYYDTKEFHQATCQAVFPSAPRRIIMTLGKDFKKCQFLLTK